MNYKDIIIFNKEGYEIPLLTTSNLIFSDAQSYDEITDDNLLLFGHYDGTSKTSFNVKIMSSGAFDSDSYRNILSNGNIALNVFLDTNKLDVNAILNITEDSFESLYKSDKYVEYYNSENVANDFIFYTLKNSDEYKVNCDLNDYELLYPSIVFTGSIDIEKTSTGLVGVETLIFGTNIDIDNNTNTLTVSCDIDEPIKLEIVNDSNDVLKFISCYNENYNEITKTKEYEIKVDKNENYNNCVNIGFFPAVEGTYEFGINIYIGENKIGYLTVNAYAEGEDERYRALFTNFGIDHPKNYHNLFKSQDINEPFVDWNMINRKSKELFLTYDEIFPYIGTYKALINSIKYLGYDDIYFREWYKKIDNNSDKEVSYRINLNDNFKDNVTYADVSLDLYNTYRKLNKLTMVYSLSKESDELDEYGVNKLTSSYKHPNEEILIKLIALREWLHKNIIAVNCKIVDITGEGIVCEKYDYITYGINMQNIEYEDTLNINAYVANDTVYINNENGTAEIKVNTIVDTSTDLLDFNNFNNLTFNAFNDNETINNPFIHNSFVKAYVDTSNAIIKVNDEDDAVQLWLNNGKLDFSDDYKKSTTYNILVGDENPENADIKKLLTDNNEEILTEDAAENNLSEATFTYKPIIQIERGEIKKINVVSIIKNSSNSVSTSTKWNDSNVCKIDSDINDESYCIEDCSCIFKNSTANNSIYTSNDYIVLYPDNNAEFRYVYDNIYDVPLFKFKNYKVVLYTDNGQRELILNTTDEYILNIIDGKIHIQDPSEHKKTTINFSYDRIDESIKEQNVTASIEYISDVNEGNQNGYNIYVNNVGEYDLVVYALNENGNLFSKHIQTKVNVCPSLYNLNLYCTEKTINNDKNFYKRDLIGIEVDSDIIDEAYNNCNNQYYNNATPLLKNIYRIPEILITNDSSIISSDAYITYDNISYALELPKNGDYIQLVNLTNKFNIKSFYDNSIEITPIVLYDDFNVFVDTAKQVLVNLIIYNKLYNNAVAEYTCKLVINNSSYILNEFIDTKDHNDYTELKDNYYNIYKIDKNYQYFVQIIDEFQVNSIFNNNDHTADLRFNIGDAKISNVPFKVNDKIRIRYNIAKLTDNGTYRSEPQLDTNKNVTYECYRYDTSSKEYVKLNIENGEIADPKTTISLEYSPALNTYIDTKTGNKYNKIFLDDLNENAKYIYDSYATYNVNYSSAEQITIDNNFNFTNNDYDREYVIIEDENAIFTGEDGKANEQSTKTIHEHHYIVRFGEDDDKLEYVYIDSKSFIIKDSGEDKNYYLSDSKISLYVSAAHHAFVKYIMPVQSSIEKANQTVNIFTDKNRLYYYIDRTFSCIPSKFDITNAYKYWINKYDDIDNEIFYKYDEPITLRADKSHEKYDNYMKPYIIVNSDNSYITHWQIYKHNITNHTRSLLMEVKNNTLFLKLFDSGVYDIVAYNYDKYGNLSIVEKQAFIYIN